MKREEIIHALLHSMEAIGKTMMSRKPEASSAPPHSMPTRSQIGILLILRHEGSQSIKNLAAKFHMTPSAATQLVNSLVKDGLLTRIEDQKDRRKVRVEMTAKGKQALAKAKKQREKHMQQILEPLTDSELLQLAKIQRKITKRLQLLWTQKKNQ